MKSIKWKHACTARTTTVVLAVLAASTGLGCGDPSSSSPSAPLEDAAVVNGASGASGETRTVTLQPGPEQGKDAVLETYPGYDDVNYGSGAQLAAIAWTADGIPATVRSVLGFDLSSVPKGAVVNSAKLSLYAWDSSSGLGQHSALSGSNAAWLQRITSSWGESTVTWRNPPTTTTANQVALPASTSPTENYLDIDVTAMVQDMVDDPSAGYGMMLRLQDETYYRRLNFCSSDHPNAALRPTLVVTFSPRDQ